MSKNVTGIFLTILLLLFDKPSINQILDPKMAVQKRLICILNRIGSKILERYCLFQTGQHLIHLNILSEKKNVINEITK